jgi:hypothetical protein
MSRLAKLLRAFAAAIDGGQPSTVINNSYVMPHDRATVEAIGDAATEGMRLTGGAL